MQIFFGENFFQIILQLVRMDQKQIVENLIAREYLAKNSVRQAFLNICNEIEVKDRNTKNAEKWLNKTFMDMDKVNFNLKWYVF